MSDTINDQSQTAVSFDKYTKPQLIDYINNLIKQYNELNANYSILYGEYQKLVSAPNNSDNSQEINQLKVELEEAKNKITSLNETINELKSESEDKKLDVEVVPNQELIDLREEVKKLTDSNKLLNDELVNIKLENTKGSSLKNINMLGKTENTKNSFQIYEIKAHENRVDNSEQYAGREFIIAKVMVQLNDNTFIWTVDFLGSALFKAEKFSRTITMNQEQSNHFDGLTNLNTMFKSIKYMLDIPDKFDANIWFDSILYKLGNEVKL